MTTSTPKLEQATDRATVEAALSRWRDALNAKTRAAIGAAVAQVASPAIVIERCGWHADRDRVVQVLEGRAAVVEWLGLTASVVRFDVDGKSLCADGPSRGWQVRYTCSAPDGWTGGGLWTFSLDGQGRLQTLRHQPDNLADAAPAAPDCGHDHGDGGLS
jgi:hypothetical protein